LVAGCVTSDASWRYCQAYTRQKTLACQRSIDEK
jgi:hypothetical protein